MIIYRIFRNFVLHNLLRITPILILSMAISASVSLAVELSTSDFSFDGGLGSDDATISRIGENHFRITLAEAPGHPEWSNMCQFTINSNASGNPLQIEIGAVTNETGLRQFGSWSYDMENWNPVQRTIIDSKSMLVFPEFTQDRVYFGGEVPMSYENMLTEIGQWQLHPDVTVHNIGSSCEGRAIYRITVTDADSNYSPESRWGHHVVNQHCYEYNAQWRIAGMIDWLLSEEAAEYRQQNVCHFVVMMNVDGPHNGYGRVNQQGIDLNRAYSVTGWENNPAVESQVVQRDLEQLMASETPITTTWSMHTWSGREAEPMIRPGPEMGTIVGPWTEFRDTLEANDTDDEIKMLYELTSAPTPTHWCSGTHVQLGVSAFCVEGNGALFTKEENLHVGEVLMKSICEFYGEPVVIPTGTSRYADAVNAGNPIIYFRLDEPEGRQAGDLLQNDGSLGSVLPATWGIAGNSATVPQSGRQGINPIVMIDGRPLAGFEQDNKTAEFNGKNDGTADMFELGSAPQLDLENITYAFWFNADPSDEWTRLICCDPDFDHDFQLVYDSDKFYLVTRGTAVSGQNNVAESLELGVDDGAWHHAVVVRNGDDAGGCRLYLDGREVVLDAREGFFSNGSSTRIGTRETTLSSFNGRLDEFTAWDRVLDEDEAMGLFMAALALPGDANCDGLIDENDAYLLAENWNSADCNWYKGDFNGDGMVNDIDVTILAGNWRNTAPTSASIPEPGILILVVSSVLAALSVYSKRRKLHTLASLS